MDKIIIKKVKFGSFMKVALILSLAVGIILGCFSFVAGLLGGDVRTNVGTEVLTGVAGGIAALIVGPIVAGIFGLITGLICFLPFKLILKIFKGISLSGVFDGPSYANEEINLNQNDINQDENRDT